MSTTHTHYVLDRDGVPVPADARAWQRWWPAERTLVARHDGPGGRVILSRFLGRPHTPGGPAVLWETHVPAGPGLAEPLSLPAPTRADCLSNHMFAVALVGAATGKQIELPFDAPTDAEALAGLRTASSLLDLVVLDWADTHPESLVKLADQLARVASSVRGAAALVHARARAHAELARLGAQPGGTSPTSEQVGEKGVCE